MKFSVVTVCRNNADVIGRAIASVTAQAGVDIEHIIIDGASTDGTVDLVRQQSRVPTTIVSEKDNGIYDAMNKGIAFAKGDVIALLNADDLFAHAGVLRRVSSLFVENAYEAVIGDVGFFRAGTEERVIRRYNSGYFRPDRLGFGIMPAHPATFLRKSVYDRCGPFKTDYKIAADFEFIARVFSRGALRYVYVPEIMVMMQAGGVSTRGLRSNLTVNREILRACRENGIRSSPLRLACKVPLRLLELVRT